MSKKGGLGRGLDALIPSQEDESVPGEGSLSVPIDEIDPNPSQPRVDMRAEELEDLAASIREHGIIQPLIVTYNEQSGRYTLIAGERRLRAARLAELQEVPVIVRQVSDQQRLEMALIENIQRADLTPLETAEAFQQLSETFGLSHEEIARQVGKSRTAVTNNLRLLKLPQSIKEALSSGKITEGHARALLGLSTPQAQVAVLQSILKNDLNVRQTEELVKKMSGERPERVPKNPTKPEIVAIEERLRSKLGTRVTLKHSSQGGVISIHYYSDEELNMLISHILKE